MNNRLIFAKTEKRYLFFKNYFLASFCFCFFFALLSGEYSLGFNESCFNCQCQPEIVPWAPAANLQGKPIYPLRGCGIGGCQLRNTRSAIIYVAPSFSPQGQIVRYTTVTPGCSLK